MDKKCRRDGFYLEALHFSLQLGDGIFSSDCSLLERKTENNDRHKINKGTAKIKLFSILCQSFGGSFGKHHWSLMLTVVLFRLASTWCTIVSRVLASSASRSRNLLISTSIPSILAKPSRWEKGGNDLYMFCSWTQADLLPRGRSWEYSSTPPSSQFQRSYCLVKNPPFAKQLRLHQTSSLFFLCSVSNE